MVSPNSESPKFKRVMLKISGEALMGDKGFGLNPPTVERIAREIKSVHDIGVEICMVIATSTPDAKSSFIRASTV